MRFAPAEKCGPCIANDEAAEILAHFLQRLSQHPQLIAAITFIFV